MDGYLEMGAVAGAAAAAKGRDGGYVENPRKQGAGEDAYMETAPPEVIFWGGASCPACTSKSHPNHDCLVVQAAEGAYLETEAAVRCGDVRARG